MSVFNVQNKLDELTAQAEVLTASDLLNHWKQLMIQHFKSRKDHIEDWQNLTENQLIKLKNRVETIADSDDPWTETQCKDLGLIAILYWNAIANGN